MCCLLFVGTNKEILEVVEAACLAYTAEGIAMRTESNGKRKWSIVVLCSMNLFFSCHIHVSSSTLPPIIIKELIHSTCYKIEMNS